MTKPAGTGLARRIYALFLLAAVFPTAVAGLIGVYFSLEALKAETVRSLRQEVGVRAEGMERYFGQLVSELRYLAGSRPLQEYLGAVRDGEDGRIAAARIQVETDFRVFAQSYPHAYQLRLLTGTGREAIRVNRTEAGIVTVTADALQDKSDRYYFRDALATPPGTVYVSPLDLNEEFGRVEQPERPVIRLAVVLRRGAGTVDGLLVINVHAALLLDQMQQLADARAGTAFLFDRDGHYLSRRAGEGPGGADFALYPVSRLYPLFGPELPARLEDPVRLRGSFGGWLVEAATVNPLAGSGGPDRKHRWVLAIAYPETELFAAVFSLHYLYVVLVSSLGVTALAGFALSRRLLGPLDALSREAEAMARGDFSRRVHIGGDDEISALGARFNRMAERLQAMYDELAAQRDDLDALGRDRTRDLETERAFLASLLQHIGDAIVAVDASGHLRLANPLAWRYLDLPPQALGQPLGAYWPDWPQLESRIDANAGARQDLRLGDRVLAASGTRYEGGTTVVLRDVSEERRVHTERRELDRQMFAMEKLVSLGELAMGVAHEIGTPLAGMKAVAQSLLYDPDLSAESRTGLARLEGEIDRLTGFLRSMHGLAATPRAQPVSCRLAAVVEDVLYWVRKEAQGSGVRVDATTVPMNVCLWADPQLLRQVLLNLLVNGLHAMPAGGVLAIGAEQMPPGMVAVHVTDTGTGIPPALIPRIFTPFFTTRGTGTGLGLAIVRQIATEHGARVEVASTPGVGSRFTLYWPEPREQPCPDPC